MQLPANVLEGLLVATGFTGAFTLLWLVRRVVSLFRVPRTTACHLTTAGGCVDVLVREIGAARREVLFLAQNLACPPVAQALADAKKRGAKLDVLLGRGGAEAVAPLAEQGVAPRFAEVPVGGALVLIDRKVVLTAGFPLVANPAEWLGQLLVIKGDLDLLEASRAAFACPAPTTTAQPPAAAPAAVAAKAAPAAVPMTPVLPTTPVAVAPAAAPASQPVVPVATPRAMPALTMEPPVVPQTPLPPPARPADILAAVASGAWGKDEEEEAEESPAPVGYTYPEEAAAPPATPAASPAISKAFPAQAAAEGEEEEDEEDAEPTASLSASEWFARLRREVAAARELDGGGGETNSDPV